MHTLAKQSCGFQYHSKRNLMIFSFERREWAKAWMKNELELSCKLFSKRKN